ncbi:MAG: hypothetical protein WC607_00460 [Candidatus Micrarchaeia archaeon]
MDKVIRVRGETYRDLAILAGELQARLGFFVSVDEAIGFVLAQHNKKQRAFLSGLKKSRA